MLSRRRTATKDPDVTKTLSETPFIHPDARITNTTLGRYTEVGEGTILLNSALGDYSYTTRFCDIANTTIGKFCNIASFARIGPTDHPLDRASLHHFMYRSADYWPDKTHDAAFFAHRESRRTVIGHDTWIGHGAIIRPELIIGDGAVVAAGAVVTRHVAPYTIVGGTPARLIRARQPEPIATRLQALAWWDWPHDAIGAALEDFRHLPVEAFLEKYGG